MISEDLTSTAKTSESMEFPRNEEEEGLSHSLDLDQIIRKRNQFHVSEMESDKSMSQQPVSFYSNAHLRCRTDFSFEKANSVDVSQPQNIHSPRKTSLKFNESSYHELSSFENKDYTDSPRKDSCEIKNRSSKSSNKTPIKLTDANASENKTNPSHESSSKLTSTSIPEVNFSEKQSIVEIPKHYSIQDVRKSPKCRTKTTFCYDTAEEVQSSVQKRHIWEYAVGLLIVAVVGFLVSYFWPKSSSEMKRFEQIIEKFCPECPLRFKQTIAFSISDFTNETLPERPLVYMFVRKDNVSTADFKCFQKQFLTMLESNGVIKKTCKDYETLSNSVPEQMYDHYKDGYTCFHFQEIDKIAGQNILFLHGVTDFANSKFSSSIFALSLEQEFPADQTQISNLIRRHLHHTWDQDLGVNEVEALLSRIITIILPVQNVVAMSCQ